VPPAHHKVELLRLLLVGASLGDAGLAEVGLGHGGLDRLGGAAVVEALGHVVVLDGHHVLDGGQRGLRRLLHLRTTGRKGGGGGGWGGGWRWLRVSSSYRAAP